MQEAKFVPHLLVALDGPTKDPASLFENGRNCVSYHAVDSVAAQKKRSPQGVYLGGETLWSFPEQEEGNPRGGPSLQIYCTSCILSRACRGWGGLHGRRGRSSAMGRLARGKGLWQVGAPGSTVGGPEQLVETQQAESMLGTA